MKRNLQIEILAEDVFVPGSDAFGFVIVPLDNCLRDLSTDAGRSANKVFVKLGNILTSNPRPVIILDLMGAGAKL